MSRYEVAIVGAGIAGLSLAWHLHRRGISTVVLEASPKAEGASVRNFGMVWVVGQPPGEIHELALRSRDLWQEAADDLGFWIHRNGSLTLAYEPLEEQVLREFADLNQGQHDRVVLSKEEVLERFPFVQPEGLRIGFFSPTEAGVDPREVVHAAAASLSARGVDIRFDTRVTGISNGEVTTANGETFFADKIVACPGPWLFDLYPERAAGSGLVPCRLQMLRLRPSTEGTPQLNVHLCAGLTMGHYANFRTCPSLPALKQFHAEKWPRQWERGIHVLVAEHADGTITVGDSHDYGRGVLPYRNEDTDQAILEAMDEFLPSSRYEVIQRWEGVYNTHPSLPYWWEQIDDSIWGLNLFGTGMTLSFGLTERISKELYGTI